MKKSNLITTLILCVIVIFAFVLYSNTKSSSDDQSPKEGNIVTEKADLQTKQKTTNTASKDQEMKTDITKKEKDTEESDIISEDKSLFIGDSRAVGLMEYSQMEKVDFFCNVGMSVFNIHDDSINIPNIGKMSLSELLDNQKYDKVYIMLGINEMGYNFEKIIEKYQELIQFIKEKEPNAKILLQANLHVTSERSNSDDIFNNKSINRLNTALSKLADNKDIFYLDVNPLFDDENGNLSADKSSDNTHLYAKYYKDWGQWIIDQTTLLTKEE